MLNNMRHKIGRLSFAFLLVVNTAIAANAPASATASAASVTDYDSQAVIIYKFAYSYVEWPQITLKDNVKSVQVCVFGNSPAFVKSMENVSAKIADKLKINIKTDAALEEIGSCNIAYVSHGRSDSKTIIAEAKKHSVLTVAPIDGFANDGGIIEFNFSDSGETGGVPTSTGNVTFKVSTKAATESNLKIATEALQSAKEVIK